MGIEEFKQRSKLVWSSGDYAPTSRRLEPVSGVLVDALGISENHRVLDVAAGDGNCALAAARRGASVCAADFSPAMLEAGRRRTQQARVPVTWREADAADLPFEDGSFDRVTSVFGLIFVPEQEIAAREVVRVTRPGGMVGFTAWTRSGFTCRMLEVTKGFSPPLPEGASDPFRWGDREHLEGTFSDLGCTVEANRRTVTFRYASWQDCRRSLEARGMAVVAKKTMAPERYEEMYGQVQRLVDDLNCAADGTIALDSEYLEVLVTKL